LIRAIGPEHFDGQQVALRVNEHVSFAPPHFFPRIVALFRTTNRTRFDGLTLNDRGAGLSGATLLETNLKTKHLEHLIPDAFVRPATKVPVDGAPGEQIVGHEPERPAAAQDVKDGIHEFASLIDGWPAIPGWQRDQRLQQLPRLVGQIGGIGLPTYGHAHAVVAPFLVSCCSLKMLLSVFYRQSDVTLTLCKILFDMIVIASDTFHVYKAFIWRKSDLNQVKQHLGQVSDLLANSDAITNDVRAEDHFTAAAWTYQTQQQLNGRAFA
jgi:hypothetical protein